jgi:glycosyltransferase involved in cell wall biosynthesis
MKGAVWITWENQRRNRELSRALGAELHEWREIDDIKNPLKKYSSGLFRTAMLLCREKPALVFCQNPSLVLSAFLALMKRPAGYALYVDAHNAGLFPREGRSLTLGALSRFVQKRADLTIVTNNNLGAHVQENGGTAFILPDRIPDLPETGLEDLEGRENILFICSYADDEPYELVFDAARELEKDVCIHVTGNFRKRGIDPDGVPRNVRLLGYVPEDRYVRMLRSVDATIDLTSREDCLVCGAYESVAAGKPQILSDTKALRDYFSRGAVYARHSAESIRGAIHELIRNKASLAEETRELRLQRQREWELRKSDLLGIMSRLVVKP